MEQRVAERIIVNLRVEVLTGYRVTRGNIENISGQGMYLIIPPARKDVSFASGTIHDLRFKPLASEPFNLPCRIMWSYKTPPYGLTRSVGIEVLNKTPEYKKFLKSLLIEIINPPPKYKELLETLT